MALLKKIQATTLVETLLASAIILIVFLIASLTLNNVFLGSVKKDDTKLNNRVKELHYSVKYNTLTIPFYEETEQWDIAIEQQKDIYTISILHKASGKEKKLTVEK